MLQFVELGSPIRAYSIYNGSRVINLTFIVIRTRSNDMDSVQRADMISVQDNNSVGVTSILIIQ